MGSIEDIVYIDNTTLTLENADYYVAKTSDKLYKIVVGISNNNGTDLSNPADITKVEEYDGTAFAVVWVEPDTEPVTMD